MIPVFLAFLLDAVRVVAAQNGPTTWTPSPFNPPSLPLAVKSPYLNVWAPQGNGPAELSAAWPRGWDATLDIYGWYASIRVDGTAYALLGAASPLPPLDSANQSAVVFTPTQTSYILKAGPVTVNATFLSPVEANDLVQQSLPFSYFFLSVQSNDGSSHSVQVYSDISGEWISGDNTLSANWTATEASSFVYLQMQLTSPGAYQEIANHPQDATVYYCMENRNGMSWQIGHAAIIRSSFANGTGLKNRSDPYFHAIGTPVFDTLGISVDLGSITSTSDPVVYAVGVVRDPVIRYTNSKVQTEERSAYYWSKYSNIHDVIEAVLGAFSSSLSTAVALDAKILGDAGAISSNYQDLLSLSTRQAMGAIEYTLVRDSNGQFNMSDVKAFLKDMGSIGSGGVNAVDVLYAAMPIYLYLNPNIMGYLLSPLLDYQSSAQYQNVYAAQDIGSTFPNATGNYQAHDQKIEQSANMLIMSLAHSQTSGDGSLLTQHYDLLNGWASYLVNNSLSPGFETTSSSDEISSTNQTNLALKGIIGIGAMAKISEYTGHSDDQSHYQDVAEQYAQQWVSLSSASDHLVSSYGSSSPGVIYNLFADKLLQLNLINSSTYALQTSFYKNQASLYKYGIPLDGSGTSPARSDWTMFAAAAVTDTSVQNSLISLLHAYASPNLENKPFAVMYSPSSGSQIGGINSPAQGAMFAPLALNVPIRSVSFTGSSSSSSKGKTNSGVIAGAVVGGLAVVGVIAGALWYMYRRRERKPTGMYNRADRIESVKPESYPSDSVLEPLSGTMHLDMHDLRSRPASLQHRSSTDSLEIGTGLDRCDGGPRGTAMAMYETTTRFAVQNASDSDVGGDADATDAGLTHTGSEFSSTIGSAWDGRAVVLSPPPVPGLKHVVVQEELRTEVDNLRREIERIKEERSELVGAPPSYDLGLVDSLSRSRP